MRILLAEDAVALARSLAQGLTEEGFTVDVVHDGEDALHLAGEVAFDAIVLDRMLPSLDGLTVLRTLRERGIHTPVLLLTALGEVHDRVAGLDAGADDYLVKPFAFAELLARIKTLLRRGPVREAEMLRLADLEIDVLRHRVTRAGQRIDLTPKEFALLHLLARRQGEVLSRSLIASQVWDMNFDSDTNVVDVAIRRLRAKIDDPYPAKLLHTVRGMGYLMEERC